MAGAPWFPLYAADLLVDAKVCRLEDAEFRLLMLCWCRCCLDGSIPADLKELSKILGIHGNRARILGGFLGDFFTNDPENQGRLISERLMESIKKYHSIVDRNRVNGSKGGRPKNPVGLISETQTKANHNHNLQEDKEVPTVAKTPRKARTPKASSDSLEEILRGGKGTPMWEAYWKLVATFGGQPKNPAPKTTAVLYAAAIVAGAPQERIQAQAQALRNLTSEERFMPQLSKWLEGQGYLTPDMPKSSSTYAPKTNSRAAEADAAFLAQLDAVS